MSTSKKRLQLAISKPPEFTTDPRVMVRKLGGTVQMSSLFVQKIKPEEKDKAYFFNSLDDTIINGIKWSTLLFYILLNNEEWHYYGLHDNRAAA